MGEDSIRKLLFPTFLISILLVFTARLFYLQVLDSGYAEFSESNAVRTILEFPNRGYILDRNRKVLARNRITYDLQIIPATLEAFDTTLLVQNLQIQKEALVEEIKKAKRKSRFKPITLISTISQETYILLAEKFSENQGILFKKRHIRKYEYDDVSHILGYVSYASKQQVQSKKYKNNELVGKTGVEYTYDKILRGTIGERKILVDATNKEIGSYESGSKNIKPVSGLDIVLTIDHKLQEYIKLLLENKVGSIVVIQPQTGEILAMASSPSFSLLEYNEQNGRIDILSLLNQKNKPLYNRAVMPKFYPPGSTFKIANSLYFLKKGFITHKTKYKCERAFVKNKLRVKCHRHYSIVNLSNAIAFSCNSFYCHYFSSSINSPKFENQKVGLENWRKELQTLGFGKKIGVDIQGESGGYLPDSSFFDRRYPGIKWNGFTIVSIGIGQGEVGTTPLQLANFASLVANKGYYIKPHILKSVLNKDSTAFQPIKNELNKKLVSIKKEYFNQVSEGMKRVVEYGSAKKYKVPGVVVAGKTGTAQNPHGRDHSIFIGFAPYNNPQVAVSVYIENGGAGSELAAPIATLVMEKYLNQKIQRSELERRIRNLKLIDESI